IFTKFDVSDKSSSSGGIESFIESASSKYKSNSPEASKLSAVLLCNVDVYTYMKRAKRSRLVDRDDRRGIMRD
uniref:Uncharacterized protein n=1 Tax=Parascaris univalens TaxID=6257 RepID=A0A915A5U5_PARUN